MSHLTKILGSDLLDKGGKKVSASTLQGKVVGLYFSGSWCGPCQKFTPILKAAYNQLVSDKKLFEVIFVSACKDPSSFATYFATMPWKAIPYEDQSRIQSLYQTYNSSGKIPALTFLDDEGKVLSSDGVQEIAKNGAKGYPFGAKLKAVEEKAKQDAKIKAHAALAPKKAALGPEPDGPDTVLVQVNTPSGAKQQRRFLPTNTIADIERFAKASDIALVSETFALRSNFPKTLFLDSSQTIDSAFPKTKKVNLFTQTGMKSKPGSVTSSAPTTSAPTTSAPTTLGDLTKASTWTCLACTYVNQSSESQCQMCFTPHQ